LIGITAMKVYLILSFFFFVHVSLRAQEGSKNAQLDSLERVIVTTKSDTTRIMAYGRLCDAYRIQGNYAKAIASGEEGIVLADKIKDWKRHAACLNNVGIVYKNKGEYDKALEYYFRAIKVREVNGDKLSNDKQYNNIGAIYGERGNYPMAIEYHTKSLKIKEAKGDQKGIAQAYRNLGNSYYKMGNYPLALEYQFKSAQICETIKDQAGLADSYFSLGNVYYDLNKSETSLEYYYKALPIQQALNNPSAIAFLYGNIANVHMNKRELDKALTLQLKSYQIRKSIGNLERLLASSVNLGELYYLKNQCDSANYYFQECLTIAQKLKAQDRISNANTQLAKCAIRAKQYQEAKTLAKEGYDLAFNAHHLTYMVGALEQLFYADSALGNYLSAIDHFKKIKQYGDSMYTTDKGKEIGRLESQYELFKKEKAIETLVKDQEIDKVHLNLLTKDKELQHAIIRVLRSEQDRQLSEAEKKAKIIEILEKDKKLKEVEALRRLQELALLQSQEQVKDYLLDRQKIIIYSVSGGLVLFLLLAILAYNRYLLKRKANQQLELHNVFIEQKNEEISSQNEQIISQLTELSNKNMEISAQRDELSAQADQLSAQRDQLDHAYHELKDLDAFKEAMSGMIVHDLKNPLSAIIGISNKEHLSQNDRIAIRQAGKRMLNLTLNILDVQKFEQAQVPLNLRDEALTNIVQEAFDQVSLLAYNKHQQLLISFDPTTGVYADFELISRVLMNLLTNAIKYTPNNGKITIHAEKNSDNQVKIAVSDTGQGIPADKLLSVFDKFSQVEAKKSGGARSTGLGLTFCKMTVEAHGGRIWAESELGKGTTFYFTLPKSLQEVKNAHPIILPANEIAEIQLTAEDKTLLQPFLTRLQALDVYEAGEILKIIAPVPNTPALSVWKAELERTVFASNQERFLELVG